jgi:uncharacterized membrane protein HdeD (DUF308 family)
MLPSVLEGLLGLWLVWLAVLDPALVNSRGWIVALSGVSVLLLGLLAFRADYLKWPAITDIVVGLVLLILYFVTRVAPADMLTFWMLFWCGCVAGIVSVWSVFYRQGPEGIVKGDAQPLQ